MRTNRLLSFTIFVTLVGCGKDEPKATLGQEETGPSEESAESTSAAGNSETGGGSNPDPTTSGGTTVASAETGIADEGSETGGFIKPKDMPGGECDVFAQDCPEGSKCMPYSTDGSTWNAAKCTELAAEPKVVGDPCEAQGGGISGVDNCAEGLICWFLDDMNFGTCINMCTGTVDAPTCPDPEQICDISNDGVIIVCLDTCNPLTQDCPDGQICFWDFATEFICDFDASGMEGQYQDPCAYINVCDYGLFCADQSQVPDCAAETGCCAPYCSLSMPECPPGTVCEPWYEGQAPPGQDDIGACVIMGG